MTQFPLGISPTRKPGDSMGGAVVLLDDFVSLSASLSANGVMTGALPYAAFVNGASLGQSDKANGVLEMDTTGTTTAGNSGTLYTPNAPFVLEDGRPVEFFTRLKTNRVDAEILVGLSSTPGAGAVGTEPSTFVGLLTTGTGDVFFKTKNAGTGTNVDAQVDLTADLYVDMGFRYDGHDTVTFFVGNKPVGRSTVNVPKGVALGLLLAAGSTGTSQTIVEFDSAGVLMERA